MYRGNLFQYLALHIFIIIFCLAFTSSALAQNTSLGPAAIGGKKYFVDKNNQPVLIIADTGYDMYKMLNKQEIDTYFKTRSQQGFTTIIVSIISPFGGATSPNREGNPPFSNVSNLTPNENFWTLVDYSIDKAQENSLILGIIPLWGWNQDQTWFNPSNATNYGKWLGARYKNRDNIFYILGGDKQFAKADAWQALSNGLTTSNNHRQLITFHPFGGRSSFGEFADASWVDFHMSQTGHGSDIPGRTHASYSMILDVYNKSTKPIMDGESRYENIWANLTAGGARITSLDVRKSAYWSFLSGAIGHTYGANDVWQFYSGSNSHFGADTIWTTALSKFEGGKTVGLMAKMLKTIPWHTLLPDQSLITSGNPEGSAHIVASRSTTFALAYLPQGGSVTLNMSKFSTSLPVSWFNPITGQYTNTNEMVSNTGSKTFTSPLGNQDAVLILGQRNNTVTPTMLPSPTQSITTTPLPTNSAPCTNKYRGDADCKSDASGKPITILDYAIWYSEFINSCSEENLNNCGPNADGLGSAMDANFNYPGTTFISTDLKVDIFDYAVWIQGYISQN